MAFTALGLVIAAFFGLQQGHPPTADTGHSLRPLGVVSVSPAANALDVPRDTSLSITFDAPVDLASVTPVSVCVWGRWSSICPGTFATSAGGHELTFTPAAPFSAGEAVGVALSTGVRSTAGARLAQGVAWSFWVDSRASSGTFTHVGTLVPGQTPYGVHGGDIDEDGDLDLCVPNEDSSNVSVFLNSGSGTFGAAANYAAGFHASPSEAADLDHDGSLDLVVANILDNDISVLFGAGNGSFLPQVQHPVGQGPRGLALLDFDGDGHVDAVTANRSQSDFSLLRNLGDGSFAPAVSKEAGLSGETGVVACDMNNDWILDLVVIGNKTHNIAVLLGDGHGTFLRHSVSAIGSAPWMVAGGDVDGDGFNDVAVALSSGGAVSVARNDGTGALLAPSLYPTGAFTIAVDLGDLDGDGDLDLIGSSYAAGTFRAYLNDGQGQFSSAFTLPAIQAGSCTVIHDYDGDGDCDITAVDELADRVFLIRQNG